MCSSNNIQDVTKQGTLELQIFVMHKSNKKPESATCEGIPQVNNQKQITQWQKGKRFGHILYKGNM